jgi:hypothetical protein
MLPSSPPDTMTAGTDTVREAGSGASLQPTKPY